MIKNRLNSFKYAFKGIADLFINTPNARIHLFMGIAVAICGYLFQISITEWCFCILCISLVLAAEAFNSAIEYLTDLVSPDYHVQAGKTKDVAAGAVLLTSIGAATVGLIIFLPKGWYWFSGIFLVN
ncbi:MAG: diacylglycerol kinase (ATP) [Maribacter sp.]|jgi:diacylglycerol kinase (ATP)